MKQHDTLAAYIDASGERQEDLAERAGVSQATISRACNGGTVSLRVAKTLAKLTGVPVESFGSEVTS